MCQDNEISMVLVRKGLIWLATNSLRLEKI